MGCELAEVFGWSPDMTMYPKDGGTGLVSTEKAFDEIEAVGWIGPQRARMISAQPEGWAPMVSVCQRGADFAIPWQDGKTTSDGLCTGLFERLFLILRALRCSGGP